MGDPQIVRVILLSRAMTISQEHRDQSAGPEQTVLGLTPLALLQFFPLKSGMSQCGHMEPVSPSFLPILVFI